MSPVHRTACLVGLGWSALMWLALIAVQFLHAEPVMMPLVALLLTGWLIFSVLATSRILNSLGAAVALLPLILLLTGTATSDHPSSAPAFVRLLIWCWALFHGYVAICLATGQRSTQRPAE